MKGKVICLIFLLFVLISCRQKEIHKCSCVNLIKTAQVSYRIFKKTVTGFGYVRPVIKRDLIAYADGIVEKVWIKEGQKIKKGQPLLCLKGIASPPEMAQLLARLKSAKAEFARLKKEYKRIQTLTELSASYAKEREKISASYKQAQEALRAALSAYTFYTQGMTIKAPIDGCVACLKIALGQAVKKGDLLLSILDFKRLLAEIEVINANAIIKPGQEAILTTNKQVISGRVFFVSPQINPLTGGRKIGIEILQKEIKIRPGDFVQAEVIIEKHRSLAIPEKSLLDDHGRAVVMVKVGGKYEKRLIQTGLQQQGYVEVLKGLKAGDEVVTTGAYELFHKDIAQKFKVED